MKIEEIIRSWKAESESAELSLQVSPIDQELSEEDLLEVGGGGGIPPVCRITCGITL